MREELAHERAVFTIQRKSEGHLRDVGCGLIQHPAVRIGRIFTNKLLLAHATLDGGNNADLPFPAQHQATPARGTAPLNLHILFVTSLGAGRAEGEFEFPGPHDEGSCRRCAHLPPWIRPSRPASVPKAIGKPASDSRAVGDDRARSLGDRVCAIVEDLRLPHRLARRRVDRVDVVAGTGGDDPVAVDGDVAVGGREEVVVEVVRDVATVVPHPVTASMTWMMSRGFGM